MTDTMGVPIPRWHGKMRPKRGIVKAEIIY